MTWKTIFCSGCGIVFVNHLEKRLKAIRRGIRDYFKTFLREMPGDLIELIRMVAA